MAQAADLPILPQPDGLPVEGPGHAMRTPLTALSAALALLGAGVGGPLDGDAAALLDIAERNCRALARVIEDEFPHAGEGGGAR